MSTGFPVDPGSNPFVPPTAPPGPTRSRGVLWGVAIGVLACLCLCGSACLIPAGFGVYQAITQRSEIEQAVDACMQDIEVKRTDAALARFSSRAIEHSLVTREAVARLSDNPHFRQYKSVHISQINIGRSFTTNVKTPQGTVANVSGTVVYRDGGSGVFKATLEKEQGQWRLFSLDVTRNGVAEPPNEDTSN
jgi:hypothetical protein